MKKLIGVHGKKGSGKDTVAIMMAQYVRKEMKQHEVIVRHYADALKSGLSAMFSVPIHYFYEEGLKEKIIPRLEVSPRELMTKMHDLVIPLYGDQIWVYPVLEDYRRWLNDDRKGVFLVADVRYDVRETDWIRKEGGSIVHVVRNETDYKAGSHSSEVGLLVHDGDLIVGNNGTLLDLRNGVWRLMEKFVE